MSIEKIKIPIFNGKNFADYKFRMKLIFEEKELLFCIENNTNDVIRNRDGTDSASLVTAMKKRERECKSLLVQSLHDNMLEYVREKETAFEMFEALRNKFERKGILSQTFCRKKILNQKFLGDGKLDDFFLRFDALIRELKDSGGNVSENETVSYLLLSLPESYDSILTALETVDEEKLTLSFVKEKLLNFELKMSETNSTFSQRDAAFQSKGNLYKCGFCKKKGHKWADCYLRKNSISSKQKQKHQVNFSQDESTSKECSSDIEDWVTTNQDSDSSQQIAFISSVSAFNTEKGVSMTWIIDSGATEHLCNDKKWFNRVEKLETPISIAIAKDDQALSASHIGDISVQIDTGKVICVKNVLYVPNLRANLLSVPRITKAGMDVVFHPNYVEILHKNKLLIAGKLDGKMYKITFNYVKVQQDKHFCALSKADLWHARLGHPCEDNLKKN